MREHFLAFIEAVEKTCKSKGEPEGRLEKIEQLCAFAREREKLEGESTIEYVETITGHDEEEPTIFRRAISAVKRVINAPSR